jgi:hypothetical protein
VRVRYQLEFVAGLTRAMTDPAIATKRTYWESNGQITRRVQIV